MQPIPSCIPEIIEMVLASARLVSEDVFIHKRVVAKILGVILKHDDEENPLELALSCLRASYTALGVKDPYENEKARLQRTMLGLEDFFTDYLNLAANRLVAGARLALAACGRGIRKLGREELEKVFAEQLATHNPAAADGANALGVQAAKAKTVLYIADGAGELLADRFFIAEIAKIAKIELLVARQPILTRATAADAEAAQILPFANVIDPGADMLGISLAHASTAFRERFDAVDLVVAKGETNWQSLRRAGREVFYILRAEELQTAEYLGVPVNESVITTQAAD